jgi:hypothetical protein
MHHRQLPADARFSLTDGAGNLAEVEQHLRNRHRRGIA